jgi:hypothetical protein
MAKVIKIFGLFAALLTAAFFANYFGFISVPWLDINSVPTYSDNAKRTTEAVKDVFE